jgi:hypothetical protein
MKLLKHLKFAPAIVFFAAIVVTTSCKKDDDPEPQQVQVEANGLTKDINDLVPVGVLTQMEDMGMPINRGGTPPNISGIYRASKFILKESNIESDFIGIKAPDFRVQFSNFNKFALRINVDYINGGEVGSGLGGFIVGSENDFSIFAQVTSKLENTESSFAYVISGTLSNDTILNLHVANFMLDDFGDPENVWIEIGQGRIYHDSDSVTVPTLTL